MSALLVSLGAMLAFWGMIWYAWDNNASMPAYLLAVALILLLVFGPFVTT